MTQTEVNREFIVIMDSVFDVSERMGWGSLFCRAERAHFIPTHPAGTGE